MTVRTQAELLALYADNVQGDISAQDLRDLVDTYFQSRTVRTHATPLAAQTGAGYPTPHEVGALSHWDFAVADALWLHAPLLLELDATQDLTVRIDFAPDAAGSGRTVSWQLEYAVFGDATRTIDAVDGTLTATDAAVSDTQYEDASAVLTIPSSALGTGDRVVHLKLTRIASTTDDGTVGVHNVCVEGSTKPPGAS